jgi:N-acetyl-gamma-glutamyl-phosphate reductase
MTRGILTTAYATLTRPVEASEVRRVYEDFYKNEPFVRVSSAPPHTKHTQGSNMCLVYPAVDARAGRLVVISVLDNLVKGAAGQAIQNMNVMLGLDERAGLEAAAVWP